jgi:hypothetical protein
MKQTTAQLKRLRKREHKANDGLTCNVHCKGHATPKQRYEDRQHQRSGRGV